MWKYVTVFPVSLCMCLSWYANVFLCVYVNVHLSGGYECVELTWLYFWVFLSGECTVCERCVSVDLHGVCEYIFVCLSVCLSFLLL